MNPKRTSSQVASAIVGFLLMAVSAPCVIGMVHDIIVGTDNMSGALVAGTFFAFLGLGGLAMFLFGLRKPKEVAIPEEMERRVLALARQHAGRLTVAELAVDTDLTIDQATAILQHFENRQACRPHLSDEGDFVYVFPGFTMDKSKAIDPLNDAAAFDAALGMDDEVELSDEAEIDAQATAKASADSW